MKRSLPLISAFTLFLFIGAGCASQNDETSFNTKPADNAGQEQQDQQDNVQEPGQNQSGDIALSATALGNGRVKFDWTIPEGVEKTEALRLVRSPEANPEMNGRNYWYQVSGAWNSATWINLPKGTYHFRLCTFENNECKVYSNDVQVEVK